MPLSRGARRCLQLLKWYAARFDDVFPYQETLARRLGVGVRQVKRYIRELVAAELVAVSNPGRGPNSYQVLVDKNVPSKSPRSPLERKPPLYELNSNYRRKEARCLTAAEMWPEQPRRTG